MGAVKKSQINIEVDPDRLARLKEFCEERGQTIRFVIERAIDRHMAAPPPLMPDPPLLPADPEPGKPKSPGPNAVAATTTGPGAKKKGGKR